MPLFFFFPFVYETNNAITGASLLLLGKAILFLRFMMTGHVVRACRYTFLSHYDRPNDFFLLLQMIDALIHGYNGHNYI